MHIREYTGLTTTTAKGYPYNYYLIKYRNGEAIKLEFKWAQKIRVKGMIMWGFILEDLWWKNFEIQNYDEHDINCWSLLAKRKWNGTCNLFLQFYLMKMSDNYLGMF